MNNNFDKFLKSKFEEDSKITPFGHKVDEIIENIFERKRKKKKILITSCSILLISTTVLAVSFNIFNLSSVGIDDTCLEIAAQNGYIQTLDIQYQKYDNLEIKIDKFLIDDINMDILFEYKIENYNVNEIQNIYIQDLYIYDENNQILYNEKEQNNENTISQTIGYSKIVKDGNKLKNTFFAQSDNFPKSEKINIKFENVIINCKHKNIKLHGNWQYEIDVLPNMINRENITYKPISNNNKGNITIKCIKMTNTGLIVNVESLDRQRLDSAKIVLLLENKKIKPNSNIFEKKSSNKIEYVLTYNLVKYDAPEQIIIKIKDKNEERNIIFIKDED